MAGKFALETKVPVAHTKAEIEELLGKYGADQFQYGTDATAAIARVQFRAHARYIRYDLPLPKAGERRKYQKSDTARGYEIACRSAWRALLLIIKAKLEAVERKITTFEEEFMSHIVLHDGSTVAEWLGPQITASYESGSMPNLLALPNPHAAK